MGAQASLGANPKLLATLENGPHLLSVAKYGFSYAGAHLYPFNERGLSPLCNARHFPRTFLGAQVGSRGRAPVPVPPALSWGAPASLGLHPDLR